MNFSVYGVYDYCTWLQMNISDSQFITFYIFKWLHKKLMLLKLFNYL